MKKNKVLCKNCGKAIKLKGCYNPTSYDPNEFCSQRCSKIYKSNHVKKKKCINCGTEFETYQPSKEWYCKQCRTMINEEKIDNDTISCPLLD